MKTSFTSLAVLAMVASGCSLTTPSTSVHQPMSVRPPPTPVVSQENGSIFQPGTARLALWEDRRARNVGDTLMIVLEERTNASKTSSTKAARKGSTSLGIPTITRVPGASLQGVDVSASSDSSFDGSGNSAATNVFTGNVSVTVIEVYPNGNLLVSGEKQVAINKGVEYIRFSGVVNPVNITSTNTVSSTRVADARIEYKGRGYIDEAQNMGFLQRLFLSISPF
ncbi:MAG: flagellar biosynthesis protein FlgH [Betaproteobacteria bacterium]|nr:flagellar biosynthesis protein FlgH [Betaproteobacteria bacterium]